MAKCKSIICSSEVRDGLDYLKGYCSVECLKGTGVVSIKKHSGSKYIRTIYDCVDTGEKSQVDVYAVLKAFDVTCPATQHALKKLLCAGLGGKGNKEQDLKEARDSISRAMQMETNGKGK